MMQVQWQAALPTHAGRMQAMASPFGLRRALYKALQNPLMRLLADLELHLQLRQQDFMLLHNIHEVSITGARIGQAASMLLLPGQYPGLSLGVMPMHCFAHISFSSNVKILCCCRM